MPHAVSLITILAAGFGLALIFGFIAMRLGLPALVGYLFAGIIIGPATPGFVADIEIASQLAEIGVMLLMFGVGLHFSIKDLMAVRKIAVPGALVQMLVATALGTGVATLCDWPIGEALVFGVSLSVASTVVLLKALESRGELNTPNGRIAVGWLIVEDLAMILVLVLLPIFATSIGGIKTADSSANTVTTVLITLVRVIGFIAFMLIFGRRLFPWILWHVTKTGSRELFTLCVVTAAISIAYGSAVLFGVSFALGAFFAGMVLRESEYSHRAAEQTLPLQDTFSVLFFVSIGMLFDPSILIDQPTQVLATVAIIIFGKYIAALLLVITLRYPIKTALTVSASLAQIGEFSFILATLGMSLGLLSKEGQNLILAGALISIALNPIMFTFINPIQNWISKRPKIRRWLDQTNNPLTALPMTTDMKYLAKQVIIVGWGSVGKYIANALTSRQIPFVVVEENRELVERLRAEGIHAVWGDAAEPLVLIQAHAKNAKTLVIATSKSLKVRQMAEISRQLNPDIDIIVRSHNLEEAELLNKETNITAFVGENELANAMVIHLVKHVT
ncbi:MAG: cation:proton antiporter [Pseudomonadota bacterium]